MTTGLLTVLWVGSLSRAQLDGLGDPPGLEDPRRPHPWLGPCSWPLAEVLISVCLSLHVGSEWKASLHSGKNITREWKWRLQDLITLATMTPAIFYCESRGQARLKERGNKLHLWMGGVWHTQTRMAGIARPSLQMINYRGQWVVPTLQGWYKD